MLRREMFPGGGGHMYLGFHNCFYSDRVLGTFFFFSALQIRKQEGRCGKETILMKLQQ